MYRGSAPSNNCAAGAVAARADPAVEYLDIGGFELDSGATLPQHARLAYRIFSDGEGPLVLQPTSFGAVHTELEADAGMLDEAFGAVWKTNFGRPTPSTRRSAKS